MTLPTYLTISQLCEKHPAFRQGSIRQMIHNDKDGKGIKKCIVRMGVKILIDELKFFKFLSDQKFKSNSPG